MIQFGVGFRDRRRAVPEDDPGDLDALCFADGGAGRVSKLVRVPRRYAGLPAGVLHGLAVRAACVPAARLLRRPAFTVAARSVATGQGRLAARVLLGTPFRFGFSRAEQERVHCLAGQKRVGDSLATWPEVEIVRLCPWWAVLWLSGV